MLQIYLVQDVGMFKEVFWPTLWHAEKFSYSRVVRVLTFKSTGTTSTTRNIFFAKITACAVALYQYNKCQSRAPISLLCELQKMLNFQILAKTHSCTRSVHKNEYFSKKFACPSFISSCAIAHRSFYIIKYFCACKRARYYPKNK